MDGALHRHRLGPELLCALRPTATRPATVKRAKATTYLLISDWPGRKIKGEPQIVYGYQAKDGGAAALGVGNDKFTFFIRNAGKDGNGWLQSLTENQKLIDTMRAGVSAVASGTTAEGRQDHRHLQPAGLRRGFGQGPRRLPDVMAAPASLIGLDRAALKTALVEAGVPDKSANMRVSQLWNWIYVHGAKDFAAMTNLARDFRTLARRKLHPGASRSGDGAGVGRRHPQMAA